MSRRAKIVCTLGPASSAPEAIRALIDAGMDVARLNFSHGTHAGHAELYGRVRQAAAASGRAIAVLADLQGPKIRLGAFAGGGATLEGGAGFVLTTESIVGDARRAATTYAALPRDVHAGDTLLLADGAVRLVVEAVEGEAVRTRVAEGGRIGDHQGINLPGVRVSAPALGEKDLDDLRFARALGVDLVALSFVREPADAEAARRELAGTATPLIAKIERPEAVERLDAIVEAFDGIMVARGDLGVELPPEQVPVIQKRAIESARAHARPVIVATQMLESMIEHPRPTRAETSDVANAVLDGADALMLSGETSVGAHPIEAAATMCRIVAATEAAGSERIPPLGALPTGIDAAIAAAATALARDLDARALIAVTRTGATARRLARHRCPTPLLAFTTEVRVRARLALVWGVETFVVPPQDHTDAVIAQVDRALLELDRGRRGDLLVVVAGTPPGTEGTTNTIRVHRLGSA